MLYAVYPRKSQKDIIFDYDKSENYYIFDEEKKISSDAFKISYIFNGNIKKLQSLDFVFTNGPILVSEKIQKILQSEVDKGFVQFFDVTIDGYANELSLKALHVIHNEITTNLNESVYEEDDDEFEFDIQILNDTFEWDLSIAKSKEVPFQLVINEGLKNRFIEGDVKNINLYSKIDHFNDKNSIVLTL
ncbi:hypothetical protein G9F32_16475 [Acinetobacter sp. 194]|uniref:hypothetical protein n=1 Tax=Acinetobacter shaoyimingii TaxID=2715164 RepID=UPI0014090F2C|nr:hypothetical protein [Acinetobacter shaoyimingii]NHB59589.1 hypothetical protein [Acinetobacter shaoyimingii]